MAETRKYTIVVKKNRVEVEREVYYAYHQEREAERYQRRIVNQREMSLERFQESGVNIEYRFHNYQMGIDEELIEREVRIRLYQALEMLTDAEYSLISELFFAEKSIKLLSLESGIPRMALHDRKQRILKKIKKYMKN